MTAYMHCGDDTPHGRHVITRIPGVECIGTEGEDIVSASDIADDINNEGKEIVRYADKAMFDAEPMERDGSGRVSPKVYLLNMTPDPLGAIAAACKMYEGKVVRSIADDVTDEDRRHYFEQVQKTHLQAPFEFVDFHFMLEGVTRSFTHQMVRQRTAVFAQESLRFAVKDSIDEEVGFPPSLAGLKEDDPLVRVWQSAVNGVDDAYHALVHAGMPAEDARGLLPHNITTRLHYKTNLRNLMEHAGNRLCTQAQFEWRLVWMQIVTAIRRYDQWYVTDDRWQQETIADLFRPICYLTGKCEFKASFDRACSIRDRVEAFHEAGVPSSEWQSGVPGQMVGSQLSEEEPERRLYQIPPIYPQEWLLDPTAARVSE